MSRKKLTAIIVSVVIVLLTASVAAVTEFARLISIKEKLPFGD